ncbi:hypothetical protein JHK82_037034 [Glycine max]|nr:hypothetical protein JHK85_037789 [Glycine max]KAG4977762.1 hypothetical protein JHK86_037236 [Glycine max]KAG5113765.1 hypothetical protein JHK82_037034 [Glycine max]
MESKGVSPDVYSMNSVLHACACSNSLDKGRDVHNYIRKDNMTLRFPVSNGLMDMYAKCGSMEKAYLVFSQIPVKDIVSWNTMIGACGSLAALEIGRGIHGRILRNGYSSELHVANALIDMYVKCGSLVHARLLFDMIPEKDLITWTVMIAGYGMHGFGNEAIATFQMMRIADLLARTGNLLKAHSFIETMPIKPDATIWGALFCGCRIHHDVELAEKVAEHVFELEPDNTGYYVLLANI